RPTYCERSLLFTIRSNRLSGARLSITNSHNSALRLQLRHFATSIFPADRYLVPMPLTPVTGHELVRRQLSAAIGAGRLPQVLLLTGPHGIGKQRLALWLAGRLLCEQPGAEPCGQCPSCRRVRELAHPDVHPLAPTPRPKPADPDKQVDEAAAPLEATLAPRRGPGRWGAADGIPRPKAADTDKQVDEAAELLEATMAERRASGRWGAPDGMSSHGIASARLLMRRAALKASEGGWRVFIIGRADRLVPQESSQEAANALLKLLEEPPPRSVFVLTTAEPGQVLPTIRSRAVPIRLGRLSDDEVAAFAREQGLDACPAAITAARGAIGRLFDANDQVHTRAVATARAVL